MRNLATLMIILILFATAPVFAMDAKIWTDLSTYNEDEQIRVKIRLPLEKFSSCETYLIDPTGNNIFIKEGSCVAGISEFFDDINKTKLGESYIESAELIAFESLDGIGKGEQKFGTWGIRVIVKKDFKEWAVLSTTFDYAFYNTIIDSFKLDKTKIQTFDFLGSPVTITIGKGCDREPVELSIRYFGGTEVLMLKEGEKGRLPVGLISITNIAAPCSNEFLELRFEQAINPNETSIKVSVKDKKMQANILGENKEFALPKGQRALILNARVKENDKSKEITIEIDNDKNSLLLGSDEAIAQTKQSLAIQGSQLYCELDGQLIEINVLPDTVLEKASFVLNSIEKIEIDSKNCSYLVEGFEGNKYTQLFIDSKIGEITNEPAKTIETPTQIKQGNTFLFNSMLIGIAIVMIVITIYVILRHNRKPN